MRANLSARVTLTNSKVSGNVGTEGGGVLNDGGRITLTNSTVSDNIADAYLGFGSKGGGMFNRNGTATLTNSTVSGNTALGNGGGVFNEQGRLSLTQSTVSGNRAGEDSIAFPIEGRGGGVFNLDGRVTLARSLISGNSATDGSPEFHSFSSSLIPQGGIVNVSNYNLFGSGGNAGISGFSTGLTDIIPGVAVDKILKPLADNGGPTKTHALPPASPAVDAAGFACSPVDQRGITRPQGLACDIGAFEFMPQILPP